MVSSSFPLPVSDPRDSGFHPDLTRIGWRIPLASELEVRVDGGYVGVFKAPSGAYKANCRRHDAMHNIGTYHSALEAAQHRKLYLEHELGEHAVAVPVLVPSYFIPVQPRTGRNITRTKLHTNP